MQENIHNTYDAFGGIASPATLTAAQSGNTATFNCKYLKNIAIDFAYIPLSGQTDRVAYLLVELSNDEGTTFVPISIKQEITTGIKVYVEGATLGASGPEITVPGDLTSTGGTTYKGQINLSVQADRIKISVRESGSANFGTFGARVSISS